MSKELNEQLGTTDVIWNLEDLYESTDDELIHDDVDLCEQEAGLLAELAGQLAELKPAKFARTVKRLERIAANLGRLTTYAYLNFSTKVKDAEAGAFLQEAREADSRIRRQTVFFDLEWSKMDQETAEAFLISVSHIPLLTVGLNCALGAKQLTPYLQVLSDKAEFGISAHPNAGLPNAFGEYDESPQDMAYQIKEYLDKNLINIIGGCCGTTPDHITAIAEVAKKYKPRKIAQEVSSSTKI